jgi:hypothetical protein
MGNKLYVGNLSYNIRDDDLQQAFAQYGTVSSAKVMMDRDTGRSKGFGFVEMGSDPEAQAAINGMNGQALDGRAIVVNEARPREERPGGFGGGGGGGRSGGGGYGGGGGSTGSGGGGYGGGGGSRSRRWRRLRRWRWRLRRWWWRRSLRRWWRLRRRWRRPLAVVAAAAAAAATEQPNPAGTAARCQVSRGRCSAAHRPFRRLIRPAGACAGARQQAGRKPRSAAPQQARHDAICQGMTR